MATYEEDQEAQAEWEMEQEHRANEARQAQENAAQEPEIVPCYKCGDAMYQISDYKEGNVCTKCSPTI